MFLSTEIDLNGACYIAKYTFLNHILRFFQVFSQLLFRFSNMKEVLYVKINKRVMFIFLNQLWFPQLRKFYSSKIWKTLLNQVLSLAEVFFKYNVWFRYFVKWKVQFEEMEFGPWNASSRHSSNVLLCTIIKIKSAIFQL